MPRIPETPDTDRLTEVLERLEARIADLQDRVAALEARHGEARFPGHHHGLDPDTLRVISAAVAAYLGETPRLRSVRLLSNRAWAQEGRATIQGWYSVSPPAPSNSTR